MAIGKVNKLVQELKLVQRYVHTERNRRKYGVFSLIGFHCGEDIHHFLTILNKETRLLASIQIFKESSNKSATILLNHDAITPHLIAIKIKDSEFFFQFKEESYFIGLLINHSISKVTGKLN